MANFCKTCKANGHCCDAREGSEDCIFCEDGVACPVTTRQAKPENFGRPEHTPMLANDVLRAGKQRAQRAAEEQTPKPVSNYTTPVERQGGRNPMAEVKLCSVDGCNTTIKHNNLTGRCKAHYYIPKAERRDLRAAIGPGAPVETVARATPDRALLAIPESMLDAMFLRWPLVDKAACVQAFLDRMGA